MSPMDHGRIARRFAAAGYVLGLATAAVAWVLVCAWAAPAIAPPRIDPGPITYKVNELAPCGPTESWQERHDRLKALGKETPR